MPAAVLLPNKAGGEVRRQAVVQDHTPRCRSRSSRCPASSAGGPSNTISPFDRISALSAMRERARKSLSTMTVATPSARIARDGAPDLLGDQRRQPLGRLVDEDQVGVGHQRAADRQHLLLAAGELVAAVAAPLGEAREQRENPLQRPPAPPVAPGRRRHDRGSRPPTARRRCRAPRARRRRRRARSFPAPPW